MSVSLLGIAGAALALSVSAQAEPMTAAAHAPSYHLTKTVKLGGEGGWDYLTVDPVGKRLYISRGTYVSVIDTKKLKEIGKIKNTPGVHGIALDTALNRGFTSNGRDNSVSIFDLKTLKETARLKVGDRPDAIIFDPSSARVFTFNGGSGDATAIDAATSKVVGTITLAGRPEFAVADEQGNIFVNIEDKSEVQEFDAKTLTISHTWPLAPGEEPSGIAIDRQRDRLFSTCSNQKLTVLDTSTGNLVATPTIGNGPDAAGFDPSTHLVFSSNGEDGTVSILRSDDAGLFPVVATVPTQAGARTMAVDTVTHQIYLVTATVDPKAPKDEAHPWRRSYVPGSFTLLLLEPESGSAH